MINNNYQTIKYSRQLTSSLEENDASFKSLDEFEADRHTYNRGISNRGRVHSLASLFIN